MGHHHHHHHHINPEDGDRKVAFAIFVNMVLTVAQVIGGIFSGSLALIADALHNFSDAVALIIAFVARKIARRPATGEMPFGYARAEVVAALVNYTTLIVIGLYLLYEAVMRFFDPQGVDGWLIVIIAGIALVVDLITALLTYRMAKTSVNIRAAFLHNLADALGSVAVIVAGTLIILFDWKLVDPIVTLLIAGYILWHAYMEIGEVIRILMNASPRGLDTETVVAEATDIASVADIHNARLWQVNEHDAAFDAHVVIEQGGWSKADEIKAAIKKRLLEKFDIKHFTLELECNAHACNAPKIIGP